MKPAIRLLTQPQIIADLMAGLSVAFILLPEAVAYAAIAHLSFQSAITGAMLGLLCYAWRGGSPYAIVAPTASAAALLAAIVLSLHPEDRHTATALGMGLVILTGIGLLLSAKAELGRLSAFVSRPVLHGFSFALAFTIICRQLPVLLGVDIPLSDPFHLLLSLSAKIEQSSPWSILIGSSALLILFTLKRHPKLPGAFIVLSMGILLSSQVDLAALNVDIVGPIHIRPPTLIIPEITLEKWLRLAELALGLVIIIVAESWGSIRSISLNHHDSVEPNQELAALGTANLISGLLQGMPVGAGFSASSANESAGAHSKWAGIFAALVLLTLALFGQRWIGLIPQPIVAAAIINALSHALNPKALIALWRIDRDQYLALAAMIAVLLFGLLHGMLIGIGLSLAAAIRGFSQPIVRELGELDDTRDYVDRQNHPGALPHAHILILRPEEPLFFASVEGILGEVQKCLKQHDDIQILILSLEESANLDSTAAESLLEFADRLNRQQVQLFLARVKDPITELLSKTASAKFENKLFWSVYDAVVAAKNVARKDLSIHQ